MPSLFQTHGGQGLGLFIVFLLKGVKKYMCGFNNLLFYGTLMVEMIL